MDSTQETNTSKLPRSDRQLWLRVFDVLSGFGLATILLLLMAVLTWFATLEQIDNGLHATLNKYFHWKSVFLLPEINGNTIPLPLPGGYWVGAVLLLNLILGGIIRARKGWKHIGNLIAHSGIILMLVAGGVAHHFEERGNMAVWEGESSNVAEDYFEYVVEVIEIKDGKPAEIRVIRGEHLKDLKNGRSRIFRLPGIPFDLELAGYLINAAPVHITQRAPNLGELRVDGYYLFEIESAVEAERNVAGCYARVIDDQGNKQPPFILSGGAFYPYTVEAYDRTFVVNMRKRLWPMPFTLHLDEFMAEFHPGTMRPKSFVSEVTRIENETEAKVTIQMNEPMRYEGLTFYQASYGPSDARPGDEMYSVFEVVSNPADKWPEYSLYIVAFGMGVAFLIKLTIFIIGQTKKKP